LFLLTICKRPSRNRHSFDPQRISLDRARLASGDQSAVEPPGPIPNPEVKRRSADGSGTTGPVRVGRRQVLAPPFRKKRRGTFFCGGGTWCEWSWRVVSETGGPGERHVAESEAGQMEWARKEQGLHPEVRIKRDEAR